MNNKLLAILAVGVITASPAATAVPVTWTDWSRISSTSAAGDMGGVTVTVKANSGNILVDGTSQTACGTNYWTEPSSSSYPPAYTDGSVSNAPTACEQVALNSPVSITVSFSSPVDNLYMALLSIGQPNLTVTYDFDTAFTVDSNGIGYWSGANGWVPGSYTLGADDTISMNEIHGVLAFNGPVSSLSFTTSPSEYWHAFTFGTAVPEPGTLTLLGLGLLGLGFSRRRKNA